MLRVSIGLQSLIGAHFHLLSCMQEDAEKREACLFIRVHNKSTTYEQLDLLRSRLDAQDRLSHKDDVPHVYLQQYPVKV